MLKPTLVRSSSTEAVQIDGSAKWPVWPRISLIINALLLLAVSAMALGKARVPPLPCASLPSNSNLDYAPPPPEWAQLSREPQSPDWTQEPRAPPPPELTQQPWVPPLLERTQQPPTPPTPERTQRWKECLDSSSWSQTCDMLHNNPVTFAPSLGLAYVEVRKSASEGIRGVLRNVLNADWYSCGESGVPSGSCSTLGRCTALCVNQSIAQKYFWFSFVRNPVDRFFSGLAQAKKNADSTGRTLNLTKEKVVALLKTTDMTCSFNAHVCSQLAHLRLHLADGAPLRMNFIGHTGTIMTDFQRMLREAAEFHRAHGRDLAATPEQVSSMLQLLDMHDPRNAVKGHHGSTDVREHMAAWRSEALDALVRDEYAEDIACFEDQ